MKNRYQKNLELFNLDFKKIVKVEKFIKKNKKFLINSIAYMFDGL